jgi:hypothetical protein
MGLNGVLAGLVSITANCHLVEPWHAIVIGSAAAIILLLGHFFLKKLKIDDPCDATVVHGFCGIWGLWAAGIFCIDSNVVYMGYPESNACKTGQQFAFQIVGSLCIFVWTVGMATIMFLLMKFTVGLRISQTAEDMGLDASEHGAGFLVDGMETKPADTPDNHQSEEIGIGDSHQRSDSEADVWRKFSMTLAHDDDLHEVLHKRRQTLKEMETKTVDEKKKKELEEHVKELEAEKARRIMKRGQRLISSNPLPVYAAVPSSHAELVTIREQDAPRQQDVHHKIALEKDVAARRSSLAAAYREQQLQHSQVLATSESAKSSPKPPAPPTPPAPLVPVSQAFNYLAETPDLSTFNLELSTSRAQPRSHNSVNLNNSTKGGGGEREQLTGRVER